LKKSLKETNENISNSEKEEQKRIDHAVEEQFNKMEELADGLLSNPIFSDFKDHFEESSRSVIRLMMTCPLSDPMGRLVFYERCLGKLETCFNFLNIPQDIRNKVIGRKKVKEK